MSFASSCSIKIENFRGTTKNKNGRKITPARRRIPSYANRLFGYHFAYIT